jgi:SAM-dependent methyltransferase
MSAAAQSPEDKLRLVLPFLRCPVCAGEMSGQPASADGELVCSGCSRRVPVRNGIPRFVQTPEDELARRTQASFGYEWTHFDDWQPSGSTNFQDYFSGIDLAALRTARVLDAGCGMGRHARQLAAHSGLIVAVDFSQAIDAAARNFRDLPNVGGVQGDLTALPVADDSFDFVYSMGVVHHLADTEGVVRKLAGKLRPGGRLRLYLYWKREGWSGRVLTVVSAIRRITTRLPFPVLKALCWLLSVVLFGAVVLPYRLLKALGVPTSDAWPLFVYTKYPFNVLYNDQFDRFSAPLEKRYSEEEARRLLEGAGLRDVRTRPMFGWLVDGVR